MNRKIEKVPLWIKVLITVGIMLVVYGAKSYCTTYYCDPDSTLGWSLNDGSAAHPWGALGDTTMSVVESKLDSGDVVILKDGYHGVLSFDGFDCGGTVSFIAETYQGATLSYMYFKQNNSDIRFKGILVWPWASGEYVKWEYEDALIEFDVGYTTNTNITLDSLVAYNSPTPFATYAAWTDSALDCVYKSGADSVSILNCIFKNGLLCVEASSGSYHYIKNCTLTGFLDDAVKVSSYSTVEDCIIGDCYNESGGWHNDLLQIFGGVDVMQYNVVVQRNLMYALSYGRSSMIPGEVQGVFEDEGINNAQIKNNAIFMFGVPHGISLFAGTHIEIVNNTIVDQDTTEATHPGIYVNGDDSLWIYNNMVRTIDTDAATNVSMSNNYTGFTHSTPYQILENVPALNAYPLATADSLINNGVENTYIPNDDLRGYARPDTTTDTNDIGAYEYDATEEGDETPPAGDTRTSWYATGTGAGDSTGYDFNNALPFADHGDSVTAGDSLYCKLADLTTLSIPADTLTYIVSDLITIDGRTTLSSFTRTVFAGATTDTVTSTFQQFYYASNATFTTARDTTTGDGRNYYYAVGMGPGASDSTIFRGSAMFIIPAEATTVTAATVQFEIESNVTAVDDTIYLVSAYNDPSTATTNYSKFHGRVTASTDTSVILSARSTVGLTTGWESWTVNAHGLDSLEAAAGDTMKYFGLHKRDYSNTGFLTSESYFTSESQRLIITYGSGDDSVSTTYDPGYVPYYVEIGGVRHTISSDSTAVNADSNIVAIIGTKIYFADGDTVGVVIPGNIGINNGGKIGTRILAAGNVVIKNFNTALDSIQYFERGIIDSVHEATGADTLYRPTITNSDTVQYGTGVWQNSLAANNTVQDTTGAGGYHTVSDSTLETDYTLSGLGDKAPNNDYYGAVNYSITTISVTSPNGNETWYVASTHNITWTSTLDSVKIYFADGSDDWTLIATDTDGSPYSWTIPDSTGTQMRVKISDAANEATFDTSDDYFTISSEATVNTNSWGNDTNSWADKPSWGTAW